jgi:hypothetical protein
LIKMYLFYHIWTVTEKIGVPVLQIRSGTCLSEKEILGM